MGPFGAGRRDRDSGSNPKGQPQADGSQETSSRMTHGRKYGIALKARNATPAGVAFRCLALVTGLPANGRAVDFIHRSDSASRTAFPFEGRSLAVALAGYLVWLWLARFPCSRYITGAIYLAINVPFGNHSSFQRVTARDTHPCLDSGSENGTKF